MRPRPLAPLGRGLHALVFLALCASGSAFAQPGDGGNPLREQQADGETLTTQQARLAERYDQLELLAGRLAELSRATQPRRARLLRQLVAKSRERDISGRFGQIVDALDADKLANAAKSQAELQADLHKLLELLLQEDRDRQIESERKRIRKYLAELKRLIQLQRGIKARTDGGDELGDLTKDQEKLAKSTGELEGNIRDTEGGDGKSTDGGENSQEPTEQGDSDPEKPSDGKSGEGESKEGESQDGESQDGKPSDGESESKEQNGESQQGDQSSEGQNSEGQPQDGQSQQGQPQQGQPQDGGQPSEGQPSQGQGQPQQSGDENQPSEQSQSPAERAQQRLQRAQQRMQKAIEELEKAQRDEAVERQESALRELEQAKAELERILRQLREEELERMLVLLEARFRKMLDMQVEVYEQTQKLEASQSSAPEHEVEIASSRLARQERQIVREAERALVLLREDGTTVAFPEAIEQARDDMQSVAKRLSEVKIGLITQGLEEDIITALEETLAALQQALEKAREQRSQQQQQQQQGSPDEQPLVDQLAELRMIRALQNRINSRTERYGEILGDEPAIDVDLLEALDELAQRQERVFQATRDLDSGRNQ